MKITTPASWPRVVTLPGCSGVTHSITVPVCMADPATGQFFFTVFVFFRDGVLASLGPL